MDLLTDLETAASPKGKSCKAGVVLAALTPEERAASSRLAVRTLAAILTRHGHRIGKDALAEHRNGRCSCQTPS